MLIIGHRGASGYEPENTLLSFEKAIELKTEMIEFDVHLCKTGEVVIIHDFDVGRTTDGQGLVRNFSFNNIRELDAGKGQKIPELKETLDLIDKRAKVNIELKGFNTSLAVSKIIKEYINEKGWEQNSFLVSSFLYNELVQFRKQDKKTNIGVLVGSGFINKLFIKSLVFHFAKYINAYSINIPLQFAEKKFVEKAHKKGLLVFAYTVNEKEDAERMKVLGLEGIFSNFPDIMQKKIE